MPHTRHTDDTRDTQTTHVPIETEELHDAVAVALVSLGHDEESLQIHRVLDHRAALHDTARHSSETQ